MGLGTVMLVVGGQVRPPLLLALVAGSLLLLLVAGLGTMVLARSWVVARLPHGIRDAYHRFHEGTLGSFRRMHLVLGLGVLAWLCEFGRLFFVIQAVGAPVALGLILFVPMANGVLASIPLTPGGLGIVETGISGLLQLELTVEVALAVALIDRTISYLSILVTGGLAFALRQLGTARRQNARATLA